MTQSFLTPSVIESLRASSSKQLVICGSGHRPNKLWPPRDGLSAYDYYTINRSHCLNRLIMMAGKTIGSIVSEGTEIGVEQFVFITGGALGWDTALAIAVDEWEYHHPGYDVRLHIAIPFHGFHEKWDKADQSAFERMLKGTAHTYVSAPGYEVSKLHRRNQWMVGGGIYKSRADLVLALYNGEQKGGTKVCLDYAKQKGVAIANLWPSWVKHSGFWATPPVQKQTELSVIG